MENFMEAGFSKGFIGAMPNTMATVASFQSVWPNSIGFNWTGSTSGIWAFAKIRGTFLGGPYIKDYSILGSIVG